MNSEWLEREALIVVKAYPQLSLKYHETVCVAAITEQEGWVRLYPINFRVLPESQQFRKYQVVHLRMKKHQSRDRRPESYRPDEHSFVLGRIADTRDRWRRRWHWLRPRIAPSMCALIRQQKADGTSMGCIRPKNVRRISVEDADPNWSEKKQAEVGQLRLFDQVDTKLEKIPFVFRYEYDCEEESCNGHRQSIIDWELMELYRKLRDRGLDREQLLDGIRRKFLDELCGPSKDTHFIVGNHSLHPGSFMVLGVFWPPKGGRTLF